MEIMYPCTGLKSALLAATRRSRTSGCGLDRYMCLADGAQAYVSMLIETRAACVDHYGARRRQQHVPSHRGSVT